MKNLLILSTLLLAVTWSIEAQSVNKKEAKKKQIKSVSEWETDLRTRKAKDILESYVKYNQDGEVLEIIERNNDGEVTLHEKYEYDKDGNKITEFQYDSEGELKKKHVYKYVDGLRTERATFDYKGRQIGKKRYVYEFYEK